MQLAGHDAATDRADGPEEFVERYRAAYRLSYRLLGDPDRATAVTRESLAGADAASWPRSARLRTVRTCRAAGTAALRSAPGGRSDPHDERARLRGALRALPGRMRAVFMLIRVAELPPADVADALGMIPAWCDEQLQSADQRVGAALGSGTIALREPPVGSPVGSGDPAVAAGGER